MYFTFSLHELVQDGKNGFVFDNNEELATQILNWFNDFPNSVVVTNVREELLKNIKKFQSLRWKENWKSHALPLFK
jgi:glycosyltransferase involved in cell wall biosynthesis